MSVWSFSRVGPFHCRTNDPPIYSFSSGWEQIAALCLHPSPSADKHQRKELKPFINNGAPGERLKRPRYGGEGHCWCYQMDYQVKPVAHWAVTARDELANWIIEEASNMSEKVCVNHWSRRSLLLEVRTWQTLFLNTPTLSQHLKPVSNSSQRLISSREWDRYVYTCMEVLLWRRTSEAAVLNVQV